MQTFLPYPNFIGSARVLSRSHLGQQRTDNFLLIRALLEDWNWSERHPVIEQWRGYEWLLIRYQIDICTEWTRRGFKDKTLRKTQRLYRRHCPPISQTLPLWLGDELYHEDQQRRLLDRDRKHYEKYFA